MKKTILVTGSHRSGSTWTGHVIAHAKRVRYIHEPFNLLIKRDYFKSPLKHWFEYLIDAPADQQTKSKAYFESFYKVFHLANLNRLLQIRSISDLYKFVGNIKSRAINRTIIKDPIAIMSAEWLYNNYNLDVVVLVRHPAAFIASLKVKDWQFDFNHFLNQPDLMRTYLSHYQDDIKDYANNKKDIIDQGILLWNTIHDTIAYYRDKYEDQWYFVKHEDLSNDPMTEFKKMFTKINLAFDSRVVNYLQDTTHSDEKSRLKRNSADNIKTWKTRLSKAEIERIKSGTKAVWTKFYTEVDW